MNVQNIKISYKRKQLIKYKKYILNYFFLDLNYLIDINVNKSRYLCLFKLVN